MKTRTKYLLAATVVLLLTGWAGPVMAQSIYTNYYTPQFYGDYLVFYDEGGAPIYYENNNAYAVPGDYPDYEALVNHYLDNEDAYYQWFEDVGYSNLHFRRTPVLDFYKPRYYNGYIVFLEGGQPVYYVDGVRRTISRTDRRYPRLMRHFRKHRHEYNRWYRSTGRHYRWYFRPVYTDYYRPMYYDGYLVYFDASGIPFYYKGGRTVYVPRHHRRYRDYVSHYRSHRNNYDRWYRDRGRKYHKYRQPKHRRNRVIAPKAPRATHGRAENRRYRPTIRPKHKPTIVPKPHSPPPPRVDPGRHHGDRGRPHVAPPPARPAPPPPRVTPPPRRQPPPPPRRVEPPPRRTTPPPRRMEPPGHRDKPQPPARGVHTKPSRGTESRKPPKPPKPGKPSKPPKPPKKKKKHGR